MTKQLLMSSSYWVLNKTVVKLLGVETAFLLSNMVEAESVLADKEGWFYQTIDTVEEITGLPRRAQDRSLKQLTKLNIVEQANRGIPMKRYFKINYENLSKLLCASSTTKNVQNVQTSVIESYKLDCANSTTNKESIINNIDKESNNKELLQDSSGGQQTERTFDDNEFKEIAQLYQSCIGQPNGLTVDWIEGHLKDYGFEWLKNALLIAEEQGKRKKSYVNAILNNWKTEGGMKLGGREDGKSSNSNTGNGQGPSKESDEFFKKAKERGWLDIKEEDLECDF